MTKTEIIGNLTAAPETKTVNTADGQKTVCNFTVAVNRCVRDDKKTDFYRVAAWGRLGENCARFLDKGRKVYVCGTVGATAFATRDGSVKAALELFANEVEFLGSGNHAESVPAPEDAPEEFTEIPTDDDELPF